MKVYSGRMSDILGGRSEAGASPVDDADPELMHDGTNVVVSISAINGNGKSLIYVAFEKSDFKGLATHMMKADSKAAKRAFLSALAAEMKNES